MKSALAYAAPEGPAINLTKINPNAPAIYGAGPSRVGVRGGTTLALGEFVQSVTADTEIDLTQIIPGSDYAVWFEPDGSIGVGINDDLDRAGLIGGFHLALGSNASARAGGDSVPAINPFSCWDFNWRPACEDPRGMTLVDGRFWADIYLLGINHSAKGSSRAGSTIADGVSLPKLDYATAAGIMAGHGKQLLCLEEYFVAALGVTERSSASEDPKVTGLDAARTSKWGLMQASGNLWVWGTDGDPDKPRPSIFGGSWINGSGAGSRDAYLGYWADNSHGNLSARGRSDHLVLA